MIKIFGNTYVTAREYKQILKDRRNAKHIMFCACPPRGWWKRYKRSDNGRYEWVLDRYSDTLIQTLGRRRIRIFGMEVIALGKGRGWEKW